MKLSVVFKPPKPVAVKIEATSMGIAIGNPVVKEYVDVETYTGEYEVTPSPETQTLDTTGKRMTRPVVVNPIPNNYGLITWNGVFLTVS